MSFLSVPSGRLFFLDPPYPGMNAGASGPALPSGEFGISVLVFAFYLDRLQCGRADLTDSFVFP